LRGKVPKDGVFLNATAISITGDYGLCGGIPQLKLPPCFKHMITSSSGKVAIIVSICGALFLLMILAFALSKFCKMNQNRKACLPRSAIGEQYMRVSYAELVNATNSFAVENLIGAGSFGSVYKARMIVDGRHVVAAVKVLNLMQRGASQSFLAECETLRCARHRNLVQIMTVCSSSDFHGRDFKALVYKFLPNGNLDQWMHQDIKKAGEQNVLNLTTRLRIAIDVASSLDYLHGFKPAPIIHCDLKPSNILLDSDIVAHVGDFGLARFLHQPEGIGESSGWASMRGSIGYAAPGSFYLLYLFIS
jgi:serine/threonine protein kinase